MPRSAKGLIIKAVFFYAFAWAFFVYAQTPLTPSISVITPNPFINNAAGQLTITGNNFSWGPNIFSNVKVNEVNYPLEAIHFDSSTQMRIDVAANVPPGIYNIQIINTDINNNSTSPSNIFQINVIPPPPPPPPPLSQNFSIGNGLLTFNFNQTGNSITFLSLVKTLASSHTFFNDTPASKLWEVAVRQLPLISGQYPAVQKIHQSDCQGATTHNTTTSGINTILTVTWNDCRPDTTNFFNLKLKISVQSNNPIAKWNFELENHMPTRTLYYISLFHGFAKDLNQNDYLVIPATGRLIRNPQFSLKANPTASSLFEVPVTNWQHFQLFPYYTENQNGVYYATHDTKATFAKFTNLFGYNTRYELQTAYYPENSSNSTNGSTYSTPYPIAFGVFNGNWYDAAQIYRNWLQTEANGLGEILEKGKLEFRADVPQWFKELALISVGFLPNQFTNPTVINNYVTKWASIKNFYDLQNSDFYVFHWGWHTPDSLGFYQPLAGINNLFQSLRNQNIYTGVRILSFSYASTAGSTCGDPTQNAATLITGQIDNFGVSNNIHLNPFTPFASCYMNDFVQNRLLPTGAVSFFYDNPYFGDVSYNPAHGNPLGQGGSWLYDSIVSRMTAVRQQAKLIEPRFFTAHEASFEGFIRASDIAGSGYTFTASSFVKPTNLADEVRIPLQSALYHDYTLLHNANEFSYYLHLFGNGVILNLEDIDFATALGFVQGRQLNTDEPYLPTDNFANYELLNTGSPPLLAGFPQLAQIIVNHANFLKQMVDYKKTPSIRKYLTYGQFLRPLNISVPQTTKVFGAGPLAPGEPNYPVPAPRVLNGVYRANDGKIGLVFTNHESAAATFNLNFNTGDYGLSPTLTYGFTELTPTGNTFPESFSGSLNTQISVAGKSIRMFEIGQFVAPPAPPPPPVVPPPPPPTTLPTPPSNLTTSAIAPTQVTLNWIDNASNEVGFKVERSLSPTTGFVEIVSNLPANSDSFTNTGLAQNTTYYFRVRAFNNFGNSDYSNVAQATTPIGASAPNPPTNLKATIISNTQIRITWTDNSQNEAGFRIERSTNGVNFVTLETVPANYFFKTISGLTTNTTYYFRVRAYNTFGNSGYSNITSVTTGGVQLVNAFTINLYRGFNHPQVRTLQQCLNNKGIIVAANGSGSPSNETTFFGLLTQQAVQRFQANQNIVSSGSPQTTGYGFVGPKTRAALNTFCEGIVPAGPPFTKTLFLGMRDPEITLLQQFLARNPLIYPERIVTGYFGLLTQKALKNFQRKYGIPENGVVDQITRDKLNQLYNGTP